MNKIIPYKTLKGAANALDNGGRFYNIFTKARDGIITGAELGKEAGLMWGHKELGLHYFKLAISELSDNDQVSLAMRLEPDLQEMLPNLVDVTPDTMSISEATKVVTIRGVMERVSCPEELDAYFLTTVVINNIPTQVRNHVSRHYHVYRVYQDTGKRGNAVLMGVLKKKSKPPEGEMIRAVGTVFQQVGKETGFEGDYFLSCVYYLP
jgi:hypothetical protein